MAGRKPTTKEMTANLLGGLGMEQIEEGLYGKVEDDADLEKELQALLGSGGAPSPKKAAAAAATASSGSREQQKRPVASTKAASAMTSNAGGYEDFEHQDLQEDVEFDENDPELLSELQEFIGESGGGGGSSGRASPTSPTSTSPAPAISAASVATLIADRISAYQRLVASTADAAKRRRLERSVQSLNAALADARAGRQVDLDSLPPEPPAPPPPSQPQPHTAASVHQAVLNYVNPQPPPQSAATNASSSGVGGPEILDLLERRCREYRAAAAAAKAAGTTEEAMELLRTAKQFEAAIAAVRDGGQTVDPDDIPGPPPPLEPKLPSPAKPAPQQQQPQQPQPQPRQSATAASSSSKGGGGLAGELATRQAVYKELQDKAAATGDSGKSRRMGRIVSQYAEAIAALKSGGGGGYDFAGLPPPPGFDPLPAAALAGGAAGAAGAPARVSAAAPVAPDKALAQLRYLTARQLQYRQAAVQAKRTGDIQTAKRMLAYAKGCDPMIQASQAGLPVDLSQLPPLPGESSGAASTSSLSAGATSGAGLVSEVCEAPRELQESLAKGPEAVYDALEKTLKEKLAVAEENCRKFKSMAQIATADRWVKLARSATADLDYLLSQKRLKKPPPKFTFVWQTIGAVRSNPDLGENTLEVRVVNGISFPLPEGFKESELETQVRIELPISTEAPLTQSTGWVKGSANPSYDCTTRFEVNRKARSTGRVFKTRGLKFDIAYKRGFLKKDGILGSALMKLDDLDTQCTLHQGLDLVEGRKAVGGRLEVQVRLREPLGGVQTDQIREQWLIIEHTSQDLPASRQSSASATAAARNRLSAGSSAGAVPDCSAYVLQYEISLLKPHCQTNPKAAEAVRGLEQRLAQHKQILAACSGENLRQYCSVLQQLSAAYTQHAKAALQEKDKGKAEKFMRKKKEADREFQEVSSRLR